MVADMERRLVEAVNKTGFGPMGTGGTAPRWRCTSNYAAGTASRRWPSAFNCWINRRTRARLYNDGRVEIVE